MVESFEQLTTAPVDFLLMAVLGICAVLLHDESREMRSVAAYFIALLVGLGAWMWLVMPFVVQLVEGDVAQSSLSPIKLVTVVGAAIWGTLEMSDGARWSSRSGVGPVPPRSLRTVDGVSVGVSDDVWSQNHWPWSITAVESGWVHFRHDASGDEQTGLIAGSDFSSYYYSVHPDGPMSCATAGCALRPWGAR